MRFDPRKSLKIWKGRLARRRRRHLLWVKREHRYIKSNRPVLAERAHKKRAKWAKLVKEAVRMVGKRKRQIKVDRRRRSDERWGGSRYFTNRINDLVQRERPGTAITSRKRPMLLGNVNSDHNFFNRTSDAIDHALVNDTKMKNLISMSLGGPHELADFASIVVRNPRNGRDYRIQLIAAEHGTGPHHHSGVRRI